MNTLIDTNILQKKPFIIYNEKTNDSFIILNINKEKKYLFYFDYLNKERTIQKISGDIKETFIFYTFFTFQTPIIYYNILEVIYYNIYVCKLFYSYDTNQHFQNSNKRTF